MAANKTIDCRKPGPVYICDPAKNTSCTKEGCKIFRWCRCTINKEFSKTDENGKPIVAKLSDM